MPARPSSFSRLIAVKISYVIASLCGTGYAPKAPGTCGTAVSLFPFMALGFAFPAIYFVLFSPVVFWFWFIPLWAFSHYCVRNVLSTLPARRQDPGFVVIDEALGVWLTLYIPTSFGLVSNSPTNIATLFVCAFILFRIFDIAKPFPIRYFDEVVKGALGVIIDDLIAGLFAGLGTALIFKTYFYVITL